jgi:la-related protein 1
VKEAAKPVILTEAPPPAVNPWAKRMEAQKAAVKAKQASPDGPAISNEVKQSVSNEDSAMHSAMPNGESAPHKKPVEASRPTEQASRRSGPRGSRAGDKDEKNSASLPPVADPSSWPDPKSAAALEQAPRKPQEKSDSPEKEVQDESGPTRKKTWEKLEIVHSVVFETQLPPLRGSKPRGGARGGREAGSMRGNHPGAAGAASSASQPAASSASDKAPSPGGSMGPRTATTRPREGSIPARSSSQPHASQTSKRTSIDGASRDQRKSSVPGTTEQVRDVNSDAPFVSLFD